MNTNKIGYLELKRAIESCKENIQQAEIDAQMNTIMLRSFQREIKKYPKPKVEPNKAVG